MGTLVGSSLMACCMMSQPILRTIAVYATADDDGAPEDCFEDCTVWHCIIPSLIAGMCVAYLFRTISPVSPSELRRLEDVVLRKQTHSTFAHVWTHLFADQCHR